ncbi:MAG TPA: SRPBCC family protein [Terracidiphilus sp.]|jgi:uncharacterized protein YndB with AHSA1/START domain
MANEYEEIVRREIVTTRVFDAPRALVFESWTDPEQLKVWWGPHGFTNTFHHFDMKPGGTWRYTMHGPDGTNYENEMKFVEIIEPARIVIDHVTPPRFQLTVLFEELGEQTKITFRQLFETSAVREQIQSRAMRGNEENLERLANHVAKKQVV